MKYHRDQGITERSAAQRRSAEERKCPQCKKKGAMSLMASGKGYWIKQCRFCKYVRWWASIKQYPDGLPAELLKKYEADNEVPEVRS